MSANSQKVNPKINERKDGRHMVDKAKVLAGFQRNNELSPAWVKWFHENYDYAHRIASYAHQRMPGIGFMSGSKRLNAFYTVCEVVGNEMMKEDGFSRFDFDENWRYAQLILQIIRFMDSNFDTAAATFEKMARHLKPHEVQLMPELAMMYASEYRLGVNF